MCRKEDGDDRVMADLCQGAVGANADTWEDGHCRATAIIAARMRVARTRTFCSTLCAEISFRLLKLHIRARGYLSALSTIVIIACLVAAAALVRFALTAKCSLIAIVLIVQGRRSTRFRVIGSGRSINSRRAAARRPPRANLALASTT